MSRRARNQRDKRAETFEYLSLGDTDLGAFDALAEAEQLEHEEADQPDPAEEPAHG